MKYYALGFLVGVLIVIGGYALLRTLAANSMQPKAIKVITLDVEPERRRSR